MAPKCTTRRRARGSGTIQRQRDGSYIARTTDQSRSGRFPAGSEGYKQAEAALELWNRQIGIGINPNDSRQKLRDFIRLWLTDVVKPKKRPSTVEFYTRHAGYATAYIGDIPIEAVSERAIEQMMVKLSNDGLSARSINHVRAVLHNAFGVAKRWYKIPNPVEDVPRWKVTEVGDRALSLEQVATLIAAARGDRLEALYHVALTLGLRKGELLGLRWCDIDWERGIVSVCQQVCEDTDRAIAIVPYTKTNDGTRALPLSGSVLGFLRARQDEAAAEGRIAQQRAAERAERRGEPIPLLHWNSDGLIFCSEVGTPIRPSNFNRRLKQLVARTNTQLKRASAPASAFLPASLAPHDLRKTALTDLAAHGEAKAVQSIAGHADIATTMELYAGRRMGAMRAAVEAVEEERKRTG